MYKTLTFNLKVFYLLLYLCCLAQIGAAQLYPNYKRYTAENGLPSSHVYNLIQDQKGFIWIATDRGVAKYDGYSFKHFTAKDGLPSDDVFKLSEDKKGRIWLSTFNEIGYLFNDKYYSVPSPDSVSTNGILLHHVFVDGEREGHFVEISKSKVWLNIVDRTVSLIDFSPNIEIYDYYVLRNIVFLGQDANFKNWFGHFTFGGDCIIISYLEDNKFNLFGEYSTYHPNFASELKCIFLPQEDRSLIISGNDIYNFDYKSINRLNLNIKLKKAIEAYQINESKIIISEDKSYISKSNLREFTETKLPLNGKFTSIIEDKNGNLWMSSFNGILFKSISYKYLSPVFVNSRINSASVTAVYEDLKGRIWFGTIDQKLFYKNKENKYIEVIIDILDKNSLKEIFSISENPKEGIVVSGNFGIMNISEAEIKNGLAKRKTQHDVKKIFTLDNISEVDPLTVKSTYSQGNNVYVGTSRGFLSFSDKYPLSIIKEGEIMNENRIYAIAAIKNIPFLGKKSGLYKIENEEEYFLNFAQPISVLEPDTKDNLWIGTEGNGLSVFKNDSIYSFPETAGKTIKSIEGGQDNEVWILTDTDILKVELSKEKEFKYKLRYSSLAEGLQIKSINKFLISKEKLYLCTNTGLQTLDTNLFNWEKSDRKLFFTDLKVNGSPIEIKDNYELNHNENCIEINYVSLEFNKPNEVNYEYKMEGLDTMWRSSNSLKQEFWFLQPGTYTFHLKAGLNSQNISETKKIIFHIKTPWWKTPLAWIIFGLSFILIVVGVVTERSRRIIRKAQEKAKIEEQISDMRLQALQSQMNPHFIFNSLQAIQDYIYDRNEEQANRYLVNFSRLMRLILESSRKKFIFLSEELKLIELYVGLEQLRFSEQFSYKLSLSENIDQETLLLPSMLIQPFIENAINHGLFHKKDGHGLLELSIQKNQPHLIIVVTDNGIGLEASKKIKKKMQRKEASHALKIVKERTSLYNKTMEEDIDLKIEDSYDAEGKIAGTIVTLKLILPETLNPKN